MLGEAEAFQLTSMLRSVVDGGTGRVVRDRGVRGAVAGKTGTTNDGADVWFVGYTPTLVAAVWFGYDVPRTIAGPDPRWCRPLSFSSIPGASVAWVTSMTSATSGCSA